MSVGCGLAGLWGDGGGSKANERSPAILGVSFWSHSQGYVCLPCMRSSGLRKLRSFILGNPKGPQITTEALSLTTQPVIALLLCSKSMLGN